MRKTKLSVLIIISITAFSSLFNLLSGVTNAEDFSHEAPYTTKLEKQVEPIALVTAQKMGIHGCTFERHTNEDHLLVYEIWIEPGNGSPRRFISAHILPIIFLTNNPENDRFLLASTEAAREVVHFHQTEDKIWVGLSSANSRHEIPLEYSIDFNIGKKNSGIMHGHSDIEWNKRQKLVDYDAKSNEGAILSRMGKAFETGYHCRITVYMTPVPLPKWFKLGEAPFSHYNETLSEAIEAWKLPKEIWHTEELKRGDVIVNVVKSSSDD